MQRRVAITGLGSVTAFGFGTPAFWEGLTSGRSGIGPIRGFDAGGFPSRHAAEVDGFSVKDHVPKHYRKATKVMARDTELAVGAAADAVSDAGLTTRANAGEGEAFTAPAGRMGCQIGAGLIAADTAELGRAMDTSRQETDPGEFDTRAWGTVDEGGPARSAMNNLPPLWLLKYLPNMLACHVTILHGCEGPSNTITCAEASALLSIGEGSRVIERSSADVCLAGGAESKINLMGVLRMGLAGRLARTDDLDDASDALRPFDDSSRGGIIGEAGGILVLEEDTHAVARDARRYAVIEGFAASHAPPPYFPEAEGDADADSGELAESLADAMRGAIADAGVSPGEIDVVVPLGCGTPRIDRAERDAVAKVFGSRTPTLAPITKAVGNAMAGHGGVQVTAAALTLFHGRTPDWPGCVAGGGGEGSPRRVLVCAPALGGQNAALVLGKADSSAAG